MSRKKKCRKLIYIFEIIFYFIYYCNINMDIVIVGGEGKLKNMLIKNCKIIFID
jgi:hypothetical protein